MSVVLPSLQWRAELIEAAGKQLVLVLEVRIERRPADVRAIDDVLHRQRLVPPSP